MATITNELTRRILKHWFDLGIYSYRQNSTGIYDQRAGVYRPAAKVGLTDTVAILSHERSNCWYQGTHCGVEIKVGKDRLRPEQIGHLKNLEAMGAIGIVVKDFDDFIKQWDEIWTKKVAKKYPVRCVVCNPL